MTYYPIQDQYGPLHYGFFVSLGERHAGKSVTQIDAAAAYRNSRRDEDYRADDVSDSQSASPDGEPT